MLQFVICLVYVNLDVLLQLLEHENFAWGFREPANAYLHKFVVFKESLGGKQFPSHFVVHFLDDFVVPVLAHVGEASGEDNEATLFYREHHFFEYKVVHVIIVNEACACDKVMLVFEFFREI